MMICQADGQDGRRLLFLILQDDNLQRMILDQPMVMTPATHEGLRGVIPEDAVLVIVYQETPFAQQLIRDAYQQNKVTPCITGPEHLVQANRPKGES